MLTPKLTLRRVTPQDVAACAQICYDAFAAINAAHNFPPDIPSVEMALRIVAWMAEHESFYGVVAETDGRVTGSNFLDERNEIYGIGPITVDPAAQNSGVGRALMEAVLTRSADRKAPGVRLVQAAFHNRSLSLYTKLGFAVREPLAVMQGPALRKSLPALRVRAAVEADMTACDYVCKRVHGFDRHRELLDSVRRGTATVVERDERVTGYSTGLAFFGHSVGLTNPDVMALIGAAAEFGGPGILVPTRNDELFRWCLAEGLRVVEPMNLMSAGRYQEPQGPFLPSITF